MSGNCIVCGETGGHAEGCSRYRVDNPFTQLRQYWNESRSKDQDHRSAEEKEILAAMADQYRKLEALGWRDAVYCPKDGTTFLAIEAGQLHIYECYYEGEWPDGSWWAFADGDMWPFRPTMWKPMPAKEKRPHG